MGLKSRLRRLFDVIVVPRTMRDEGFYSIERQKMVDTQLRRRDIRDPRVLDAMNLVPRHSFVPAEYIHLAYTDGPLPIGSGQTISQPYIVALMTQLLELSGEETVLEVGTGSGYQAAILAHLVQQVHTIERHTDLAYHAQKVFEHLNLENIQVHTGDGSLGLPEHAPYDAIMVTAAAPEVPRTLLEQLDEGGQLVIPVGGRGGQLLERWTRQGDDYDQETVIPVAFVPLVGREGWKD